MSVKYVCHILNILTFYWIKHPTFLYVMRESRARYCGLGCSDWAVYPVMPQRWAIDAEYLFHSSRNNVAAEKRFDL